MPTDLQVMSANLRHFVPDAAPDDPDHWPTRLPALVEVLRHHAPAVVGTQEGTFQQLGDLVEALPHFEVVGYGRRGGSHDEYSAILHDRRQLRLVEWDQYWLSETPQAIGSVSWQSSCPRIVTSGLFETATGERFSLVNTHFDHLSEDARRASAELLASRLPAGPVVVTGDFNCPAEQAPAWHTLIATGLRDTFVDAGDPATAVDTFTDYGRATPTGRNERIDWILVSQHFEVRSAAIVTDCPQGLHPSDHWPVTAGLTLV